MLAFTCKTKTGTHGLNIPDSTVLPRMEKSGMTKLYLLLLKFFNLTVKLCWDFFLCLDFQDHVYLLYDLGLSCSLISVDSVLFN